MILSKECACGLKIEFETEELAQLTCPSCGRSLQEQFPPPLTPAEEDIAEPAEAISAKSTLDAVRGESCYKTLRGLIETIIGIGYIACALLAGGGLGATFLNSNPAQPPNFMVLFVSLFVAALIAVLLMALKQALLLAIDAVDILIADRADRLYTEREAEEEEAPRGKNSFEEIAAQTNK